MDVKWQYTGYILCKYGDDWSSNPGDYEGRNIWDDMVKFGILHQLSQNMLDRCFNVYRQIDGSY